MKNSPEVFLTLRAMEKYGMDFHLDIHGDEALPYNFLIGIEGIPKLTKELTAQFKFLQNRLCELSPDFQKKHGYPLEKPGKANLSIASNYIANHYGIFSTTLEMPFKDNADLPDENQGWSPERCIRLGRAFVDGLWSYAQKF
jgi:murein tripeptide amidase MpaA